MSSRRRATRVKAMCEAQSFNVHYPIGTRVRYWKGVRSGPSVESRTCDAASVLGDHTAVVWIEGCSGCIALSHVEVIA